MSPVKLSDGKGGGGEGGARSDDGEKAWSSINHAVLTGGKLLLKEKDLESYDYAHVKVKFFRS
jgi:hypothetical protein